MASQYGATRQYTSTFECVPPNVGTQCPLCKVIADPRGITSTRYATIVQSQNPKLAKSCPNCGHVYGRQI